MLPIWAEGNHFNHLSFFLVLLKSLISMPKLHLFLLYILCNPKNINLFVCDKKAAQRISLGYIAFTQRYLSIVYEPKVLVLLEFEMNPDGYKLTHSLSKFLFLFLLLKSSLYCTKEVITRISHGSTVKGWRKLGWFHPSRVHSLCFPLTRLMSSWVCRPANSIKQTRFKIQH